MVKTGISTSSLFGRMHTEDALEFLGQSGIDVAEVFLESYCEYNKKFGKFLRKKKGGLKIHSVHVLNTQYEPQLYSLNDRAREDSFRLLDGAMACAEMLGADYYTFHGMARFKKTPLNMNFDRIAEITERICDITKKHKVTLAYENVHWCYYNYIGFFAELRKRLKSLKGTFDVKQARQCGIFYGDFIEEMGEDIVTVHLSDYLEDGKMCLPGKGITDFDDMFKRLKDKGFDGSMILEVYKDDYKELSDLFESLEFIKEKIYKIF